MAKIIVTIDADLEDLIPDYLENRRQDCQTVLQRLEKGDYEGIRVLGHIMKGSGGGYGFDPITDMGRALEEAAKQPDKEAIRLVVSQLEDYLQNIEIIYR